MNKKFLHHQSKRNVITGGPCTGKSSVLRELSSRGYFTVPEAARCVFEELNSRGERMDAAELQKTIMDRQFDMEEHIPDDQPVFLDRSIVDNMTYMEARTELVLSPAYTAKAKTRYDTVLLLEPLPYEKDDIRTGSEESARRIHERIREKYIELGYEIIDVPVMPIEERADFIENKTFRTPIR